MAGRRDKKEKYFTKIYISGLKKYKKEQYDKLTDAQKAERDYLAIKDETADDSIILLSENVTIEALLDWYCSLYSVQQQAQYKGRSDAAFQTCKRQDTNSVS